MCAAAGMSLHVCVWRSRNAVVNVVGDISEQVEDLHSFLRQAWAASNQSDWLFQACHDAIWVMWSITGILLIFFTAILSANFNEKWELPANHMN